ncbi:MAG TPA: hypothetical protein ENJ82_06400 [Bacteroidetes bacterium]|nr:hypothetical protein [Bacteroidota bacterium]
MKYAEIFQLRIRHNYFADGICHALRIRPATKTQAQIDGHRYLLRQFSDRIILLGECTPSGSLLLPPSRDLVFRFLLDPRSSEFFNYTQLVAPQTGRTQYSNVAAIETVAGHFRMAITTEEKPKDQAWASVEIIVDTPFSLPPQSGNIYDIEFFALSRSWNLFFTTAKADDNLRIEPPVPGLQFHKIALPELLSGQADDYPVSGLGQPGTWSSSTQSAPNPDFTIGPGNIASQGPATNASLWLSTPVSPVEGAIWRCQINLGFAPDASNQAQLYFLADQADLSAPARNAYCLQIGEAGPGNKLRLLRISNGQPLEIGASTTTWAGNIALDLEIHWKASGQWEIWAAAPGQTIVQEIAVQDQTLIPGNHFGLGTNYTQPSHANAFQLNNLEIRLPFGNPNQIAQNRAVASTLASQYPNKNQYLFASTRPVAMTERPHKGLALLNGAVTLIAHLPNPAPEDQGTRFFHI